MRRRTFLNVTAGAAAGLTFPPLAQTEPPEAQNSMGPGNGDQRTGEGPMPHPVVHFEIGCRDSAKTQEFYKKLFD